MEKNSDKKTDLYLDKAVKGLFIFMLSFFLIIITISLNVDNIIVDFLKKVPFLSLFYSIWFGVKYVYIKNKEIIMGNADDEI